MKKKIGRMTAMQNIADGTAKMAGHPYGELGGRMAESHLGPNGERVITGFIPTEFSVSEIGEASLYLAASKVIRASAVRPTWAHTLLGVATALSQRGTCPRLRTGAVVTSYNHRILGTGYNGAPRGVPHCTEAGCIIHDGHCVRAIHAEQNAILEAVARETENLKLYCTHRPCIVCTRLILQYDVTEVNYLEDYDSDGLRDVCLQLLSEKKVGCHKY